MRFENAACISHKCGGDVIESKSYIYGYTCLHIFIYTVMNGFVVELSWCSKTLSFIHILTFFQEFLMLCDYGVGSINRIG